MFLGFDRSDYPGNEVMTSLWRSTPLEFVAIYLAPAPSHPNTGWMSAAPFLRSMGWGFAPIYVGQQAPGGPGSHILTPAQGVADANQAATHANHAGFGVGSVIYLDIELGGTLPSNLLEYANSWIATVSAHTDYWPGVYCSHHLTAAQIEAEIGQVIPTWVFHAVDPGPATIDLNVEVPPNPASSGYDLAQVVQYRMSLAEGQVNGTWNDFDTGNLRTLQKIDLDSSVVRDPSFSASQKDRVDKTKVQLLTAAAR